MYNDSKDITVTLDELEKGWEMDKTASTQVNIDWLSDWLIDWLIDWLVEWVIDWLIDWRESNP